MGDKPADPNDPSSKFLDLRNKGIDYIKHYIGVPYLWAGDDPVFGFDCSGLAHEFLQAIGLERHGYDSTADDLWNRFKLYGVQKGCAGCLAFWMSATGRAMHVEIMIDENYTVGASGGGSATTSIGAAAAKNAFVKMRPLNYRGSFLRIVDPFKILEGV